MFTLYEVVDAGDSDRSYKVFEDFREAVRFRIDCASLSGRDYGSFQIEHIRTHEYWVCDGKVFYDYVLLLREYAGTGKPVIHHTSMDVLAPDAEPFSPSATEKWVADLEAWMKEQGFWLDEAGQLGVLEEVCLFESGLLDGNRTAPDLYGELVNKKVPSNLDREKEMEAMSQWLREKC